MPLLDGWDIRKLSVVMENLSYPDGEDYTTAGNFKLIF